MKRSPDRRPHLRFLGCRCRCGGGLDREDRAAILDHGPRRPGRVGLETRAGPGDVVGDLADAALELFGAGAVAGGAMIAGEPALGPWVAAAVERAGITLQAGERAFAGHLAAERALGRITGGLDVGMLAFILAGSLHHLFFTQHDREHDRATVGRVIETLINR